MSKKSNKSDSIGNPSTIANAMYDAQKKEITSSMVLSLSFIAAGLIVAIIGVFQYFSIKGNMVDSSESIDAMAWLVIAGVGLLVGIIGLVSIMKSVVSLGQIGSWAKEAESHASPFQAQKLHRKVAAMNQSQSLQKPDNRGAAEGENGQKPKFGFFKRGRENKNKQNSEELYYKYNPQEKQQAKPPEKAPMMEQKFDYGIEEAKKLTFADEFLKKNKRDPFAQYRKDLGIEEEPEKEVKKKPKFIINGTANPDSGTAAVNNMPQPQANTTVDFNSSQYSETTENKPILKKQEDPIETPASNENPSNIGLDFSLSFSENAAAQPAADTTNNTNFIDYTKDQPDTTDAEQAAPLQYEEAASMSSSPYGVHNESDDDIFFSAKTVTPPVQQTQIQTQHISQQSVAANVAAALDNAIPKAIAPPTVVLDLDYKKKNSSEDYNFSLFEEIDPKKAKSQKVQQAKAQPQVKQQQTTPSVQNDDMFFGGSKTAVQEVQDAPDTQQNFMSNFVSSIENQENFVMPTQQPARQEAAPQVQQQPVNQVLVQQTAVQQPVQQEPVPQQKTPFTQRKKNAPKTSTPPKSKNTKKKSKKSFSEMFLNNHGGKSENDDNDSEIVKNGTRAQRKFVDASEYDEWTCPDCGKVNQEYVGLCACGARKPRAKK